MKELKLAEIGPESVATMVESGQSVISPECSTLMVVREGVFSLTQRCEKCVEPQRAHGEGKLQRARLVCHRHRVGIVFSLLLFRLCFQPSVAVVFGIVVAQQRCSLVRDG